MKIGKIILAAVLWLVAIGLGFWLYKIIQDPVKFEKAYAANHQATIDRMLDIKEAQKYYLDLNGEYANDFGKLINTVENGTFTIVKTTGDKDDTTIVTTYDTIVIAIKDTIKFKGTTDFANLKYIPGSEGEVFGLETDILKIQRVSVPVYEVIARKNQYLKGLNSEYVGLKEDLVLGSLYEATDAGSWE